MRRRDVHPLKVRKKRELEENRLMDAIQKNSPRNNRPPGSSGRTKFLIGGLLILAAVGYLIISSTQAAAQYFLTVEELAAKASSIGSRNVKVSGAVVGETIAYDPQSLTLSFTIANVPGDIKEIEASGGLAAALEAAVQNPSAARMPVVYIGPKPDLMRDQAQAILTGHLGGDGIFYADEVLLKCPTRYESELPEQSG
jgi:cytochrome c-type biogenesis protein CcmE